MSPETQRVEPFAAAGGAAESVTCPNCRAELIGGMRFCRSCGFRLGEGLAEYVETVRLNGVQPLSAPGDAPLAATQAGSSFGAPAAAPPTMSYGAGSGRRRKRVHWIVWPLLAVTIAGVSGGAAIVRRVGRPGGAGFAEAPASRSFFGGGDFARADGEGLMIESILPGSPAERAGLSDGDIIKTLDGRSIRSESDLRRVLGETPVGKTVPVEFVRDGETRAAMLTTIASGAYDARAFAPPGPTGFWGVSSLRRVRVPGTNLYGVRLGSVRANLPADMAGLKEDDIVVEFDGRPVRTVKGLSSYIDHAAPGTTVNVAVFRDGQRIEMPVKMGRDD